MTTHQHGTVQPDLFATVSPEIAGWLDPSGALQAAGLMKIVGPEPLPLIIGATYRHTVRGFVFTITHVDNDRVIYKTLAGDLPGAVHILTPERMRRSLATGHYTQEG